MTKRNRILNAALSAAIALLLLLPVFPARAAIATEGVCGDGLYWKYAGNVLTISGEGDMYDFVQKSSQNLPNEAPWRMLDSSIARVVIEEGCTGVGEYAFYRFAPLTEIVFPEHSLKRIGSFAFGECNNVRRVVIPDSVESVGASAFIRCASLASVSVGSSVSVIEANAFSGCSSLKTVTLSENCRSIKTYAFSGCSRLFEIDLSHVARIESLAFQGCALTSVSFGKDISVMQTHAFYNCASLSDVTFDEAASPRSVSALFLGGTPYFNALPDGMYTMFGGTVQMNKGTYGGKTLEIPEGVKTVADLAFDSSPNLSSVTFPSTLETIGSFAFRDCNRLKTVYIPESVVNLDANCLGKYTESMSYLSLDGFLLISKGIGAAALYAEKEVFAYECDHEFETVVSFSDCASGGFVRNICKFCGACVSREALPPAEHSFDVTVVPPGCESGGYTIKKCTVCGLEEVTDPTDPVGHTPCSEWSVVDEGTCTERGVAAIMCARCGAHLEELILEKFGHRPSEPVVLTVPSEDGAYCGCSIVRCEVCREVIEVTWIPAGDGAGPDKAASSLREALSGIKDAPPTESADYFSDGTLDLKDVAALGKIMNKGGR